MFPKISCLPESVAFKVYEMDRDGYISNGELFLVLKMMVGNNLKVRRNRFSLRGASFSRCAFHILMEHFVH